MIYSTFLPSSLPQCHASNILPLKNGDILCVWFSGTEEGMPDISIFMSRLNKNEIDWTNPVKLSDDPSRSEQNPVLFEAPDGNIWLFYTSQQSSHQDTSIIKCRISKDNGYTWGEIFTLIDKPGTFIKQPIVVLDNGDWVLPIFYCVTFEGNAWIGDDDYSAVLISSDSGKSWKEYEVPNSTGCVHMNVVKATSGKLVALFRSRWADNIYISHSRDNGRTWDEPKPTILPNNNSSIQFTKLNNGHFVLAFNNNNADNCSERRLSLYDGIENSDNLKQSESAVPNKKTAFWGAPRAPMSLAISEDEGLTWPYTRDLDVGDGYCMTNNSSQKLNREYSYPSIKQTEDGKIHITYTYFRQKIKYVCMDEDWVRE